MPSKGGHRHAETEEDEKQEGAMFKRSRTRDEAWEGVVTGKKRSSPDGQNMYHRISVTLGDGTLKEVRVRGGLWKTLEPGDLVVKRSGETAPVKIG
jgi:hypothetical protein